MHTLIAAAREFARDEDGITAIEYGLIAALIAVVAAVAAGPVGTRLANLFDNIRDQLPAS
ncbi:MAG: Flp family type IVb pilin [Pseudomonadota bacterium]